MYRDFTSLHVGKVLSARVLYVYTIDLNIKKYVFGCYPTKRHLGINLPIFTVYQKPYT